MRLGIIVFANESGLGYQSRRVFEMLKPEIDKIMVVNSSGFSKNKKMHYEWYRGVRGIITRGIPTNREVAQFCNGLTHIFCFENPLNFQLLKICEVKRIKLFIHSNYEFCDHLRTPGLALPTKFVMPSHWKNKEMVERFGADRVEYLPPPIGSEFDEAKKINLARKGQIKRFIHVVGTLAAEDRNGTLDLIAAVQLIPQHIEFELVISSQQQLPSQYFVQDKRIAYKTGGFLSPDEMYSNFDALILPRRYGGLCLPMLEALSSALPVIMTNISPNNEALPEEWLVKSKRKTKLVTRTIIDVYEAKKVDLAQKIIEFVQMDDSRIAEEKERAAKIASTYQANVLLDKYLRVLNS